MSKYIRSLHNLRELTQDIFAETSISIDTKAIVLFLAGSLHSTAFIPWIDRISALDHVNTKLKEINYLRAQIGPLCEDYLLLKIFSLLERDLDSDELQRFITNNESQHKYAPLTAALTTKPDITTELTTSEDQDTFKTAAQVAIAELQERFAGDFKPNLNALVDVYTTCRQHGRPEVAYAAVVNAMQDILTASGVTSIEAIAYSHKLATYALDQFVQNTEDASKMLLFSKNC